MWRRTNKKWVFPLLAIIILGGFLWTQDDYETFVSPDVEKIQMFLISLYDESLTLDEKARSLRTDGTVSDLQLEKIAISLLGNWAYHVPTYVTDGTHNYRSSDVYGLLANALRSYNQTGATPIEIELAHMVEPKETFALQTDLQIEPEGILEAVDSIEIYEKAGIRSSFTIGSEGITSPQMLYAMAELYLLIQADEEWPTFLYIPAVGTF